ncbi:hypothetical protein [Pseudonocardia sp.]|nr:hypothetical protein [Pseudonocardia sp.]
MASTRVEEASAAGAAASVESATRRGESSGPLPSDHPSGRME